MAQSRRCRYCWPVHELTARFRWRVRPLQSRRLMATAVPPLDPPGLRSRSDGLRICPPRELNPMLLAANSSRLVLMKMMAPARRSRSIDRRITPRHRLLEDEAAAGGRHVDGIDVVLDRNWNAMQRPAPAFRPPLLVKRARNRRGARIHAQHRPQPEPLAIERLDPREVLLHQRLVGEPAGIDGGLDFRDARRQQVENRILRRRRAGERHGRNRRQDERAPPEDRVHGRQS